MHPMIAELRALDLRDAAREESFPCEGCGQCGEIFFLGRWLCQSCRFIALHEAEWELR